MWKKLIPSALKKEVNQVSRADSKMMKQQIVEENNNRLIEYYRKEVFYEYEQDAEKQKLVKKVDELLEYLIATNNLCNLCLILLEKPHSNLDLLDIIFEKFELLKTKTEEYLHNSESLSVEYQQRMLKIGSPFMDLTNKMIGNTEHDELNGVLHLIPTYIQIKGKKARTELAERLKEGLDFVHSTKDRIREVFKDMKELHITTFSADGVSGQVDFGRYTLEDLH